MRLSATYAQWQKRSTRHENRTKMAAPDLTDRDNMAGDFNRRRMTQRKYPHYYLHQHYSISCHHKH